MPRPSTLVRTFLVVSRSLNSDSSYRTLRFPWRQRNRRLGILFFAKQTWCERSQDEEDDDDLAQSAGVSLMTRFHVCFVLCSFVSFVFLHPLCLSLSLSFSLTLTLSLFVQKQLFQCCFESALARTEYGRLGCRTREHARYRHSSGDWATERGLR